MRYLFLSLVILFISIHSFAQKTNDIYIELVSKKITTAYHADIYIEQCNTVNVKSVSVNPHHSSFLPVFLKCDSSKPAQLVFSFPMNYTVDRSPAKGDIKFYSGDSILYEVDKAYFTVLNKSRPGRSNYTDCDCNSPE
jgi:hypothetical protein